VILKILASQNAVGAIISQLTADQGPALGFVASLAGNELSSLVGGIGPTLSGLQGQLQNINSQLAQAQKSLRSGSGDFNQALGQALDDSTGASQFVQLPRTI